MVPCDSDPHPLLAELAKVVGLTKGELEQVEAILAGFREEGLLTGSRSSWAMEKRDRPFSNDEAKAIVWAAIVVYFFEESGIVDVPWDLKR